MDTIEKEKKIKFEICIKEAHFFGRYKLATTEPSSFKQSSTNFKVVILF